ncbi:SGNH/GDSL hydrolase family protein [Curvibacter gracilis]|uniref:SGNH/GDSL hydrolase family protein n=1 Tax=Curvibacter gracilis TaxID=230310 RepID=UPI000488190B|nr:SGNH/GDSL hydrolase family protein [Curvibacter gracilis]
MTTPTPPRLSLWLSLALLLSSCGGSDAPTAPGLHVQQVTVFGDSLSDVGTYGPLTGEAAKPGKFTVNPGLVWAEVVAARYGVTLKPRRLVGDGPQAQVVGGNDYAEGGARVALLPGVSALGRNDDVTPVRAQISARLAQGPMGSHELVLLAAGGNDLYAQFDAAFWSRPAGQDEAEALAQATAGVDEAADALAAEVQRLLQHGAPLVVLGLALDFSSNPFAQRWLDEKQRRQVRVWAQRFEQRLQAALGQPPGLVWVDWGPLGERLLAQPGTYGLIDVQTPACSNTTPSPSAVFCSAETLVQPDAADRFLYADDFHFTPRGHALLAEEVLKKLKALAH